MISLGTRAKINRSSSSTGYLQYGWFSSSVFKLWLFFFLLKFYLIYKPLWHHKSARPRGLGDQCSILSPRNFFWDSSHRELVGYQMHIGTLLLRTTLCGVQMKTSRTNQHHQKNFCMKHFCSLLVFFQMQEIRYGKQCWCVWAGLDSYCCTTVCNKWCVFKNIYRWIMDACRYESDCCFVVVQFEGPEVDLILHIAACVEGIYMKLSSYLLYWAPYPSVWNCDLLCCDMIRNRTTTHCNGFFQSPGNVCLA